MFRASRSASSIVDSDRPSLSFLNQRGNLRINHNLAERRLLVAPKPACHPLVSRAGLDQVVLGPEPRLCNWTWSVAVVSPNRNSALRR
jgi:hypothetical protein